MTAYFWNSKLYLCGWLGGEIAFYIAAHLSGGIQSVIFRIFLDLGWFVYAEYDFVSATWAGVEGWYRVLKCVPSFTVAVTSQSNDVMRRKQTTTICELYTLGCIAKFVRPGSSTKRQQVWIRGRAPLYMESLLVGHYSDSTPLLRLSQHGVFLSLGFGANFSLGIFTVAI